jgi:hypothetical protein
MGSTTYTVEVSEEEVEQDDTLTRSGSLYGNYGFSRGRASEAERASSVAHQKWNDDYDAERGGAYHYPAKMTALVPGELANQILYSAERGRETTVVQLMKKTDYTVKNKTLNVKLTDKEWKEHLSSYSNDVLFRKAAELFPEAKDSIFSVSVVVPDEDPKKVWGRQKTDGWKVQSRVDADTSGGKAKTVYYILANGQEQKKEFESQAEARAYGTKLMQSNLAVTTVNVKARIRREDDTDLVKLTRVVSSATAKITIKYTKTTKANPARDGFLVEFWYHT